MAYSCSFMVVGDTITASGHDILINLEASLYIRISLDP
jgi:hypothetical protein